MTKAAMDDMRDPEVASALRAEQAQQPPSPESARLADWLAHYATCFIDDERVGRRMLEIVAVLRATAPLQPALDQIKDAIAAHSLRLVCDEGGMFEVEVIDILSGPRAHAQQPASPDSVERVARAILSGHNWANGDSAPKGFDEMTPDWQDAYRNMARAAIEAIGAPAQTQPEPDPQIAYESERAEGWKRLAYATADECVARHAPAQQPASPVTDTLLARLERCAKYDFDTIEMIECKWELWDEILEALTRPAQSQQQPVAWRWRPRGATLWIYNPEAQWLAEHRDEADIEVEPLYAAPVQRQPTPSEAELVKVKTVRLYEYTRARNLMIEILRDRAWTITDRDLKAFDEAFQHAIGLLAITTSTVTSTSSCTPLSAPGDAQ